MRVPGREPRGVPPAGGRRVAGMGARLGRRPGVQQGVHRAAVVPRRRHRPARPRAARRLRRASCARSPSGCAPTPSRSRRSSGPRSSCSTTRRCASGCRRCGCAARRSSSTAPTDPTSDLRRGVERLVVRAGEVLRDDPADRRRGSRRRCSSVARHVVTHYGADLTAVISLDRSSAGTPRRPAAGSNCRSGATCSSSASTARSSARWPGWRSTR